MVKFLKRALLTIIILIVLGTITVGVVGYLVVLHYQKDLPPTATLRQYKPKQITRFYTSDGQLMSEFAQERRVYLPIRDIPQIVRQAAISAEDKFFYDHMGINIPSILRAGFTDALSKITRSHRRPVGASTITQQVAKNFLLSSEVTYSRKIKEILLALRIEKVYSKDKILELYLNKVFLGHRSYGVAAAAISYFNKSLDQLTPAEAAYIATLLKAPNNYEITRNYAKAMSRRNWVLFRMYKNGYITQNVYENQKATPITYHIPEADKIVHAPSFSETVRRKIKDKYGEESLTKGGLFVRTTLKPDMQKYAINSLRQAINEYALRHGYRGPIRHADTVMNWQDEISKEKNSTPNADWAIAIVLSVNDKRDIVSIGLKDGTRGSIPLKGLKWAMTPLPDAPKDQKRKTRPSDVLSVGDVIYVKEENNAKKLIDYMGKRFYDGWTAHYTRQINARKREIQQWYNDNFELASKEKYVAYLRRLGLVIPDDDANNNPPRPLFPRGIYTLEQKPKVNGAMLVMNSHTGQIYAMVGGYNNHLTDFNRAIQAKRQPGSSFKPMVYLTALEHGYAPTSLILDAPFVALQDDGKIWKPQNYTHRFFGEVPMRIGIEKSRNLMTIRLAQAVGMRRVAKTAIKFGEVDSLEPNLSNALGATETTLLRHINMYASLSNEGEQVKPHLIDRIQDRDGNMIYAFDTRPCPACVITNGDTNQPAEEMSPSYYDNLLPPQLKNIHVRLSPRKETYQLISIMKGVILRGTGRSLAGLGIPLAGKTGTSNQEKDAWFMSYTPDLVVGIYIGYDIPKTLGHREGGGSTSAPAAKYFYRQAMHILGKKPFPVPAGIRLQWVDYLTGQIALPHARGAILEAFKNDEQPNQEGKSETDADDIYDLGAGESYDDSKIVNGKYAPIPDDVRERREGKGEDVGTYDSQDSNNSDIDIPEDNINNSNQGQITEDYTPSDIHGASDYNN